MSNGDAEPTVNAHMASVATTDSSTSATIFETRTFVRLLGLARSSPIVPLRSSPAIEAAPIASAIAAKVIAP